MSELIYRQRLEAVLSVIQRYLPPDGISKDAALSEIIGLVDPMPPAQEVEPVYQVYLAFDKWRDVDQHIYDALTLPKRIVYTHPQSDEIRKEAERRLSAWEGEEGSLPWRLNRLSEEIDNLRAALEGK